MGLRYLVAAVGELRIAQHKALSSGIKEGEQTTHNRLSLVVAAGANCNRMRRFCIEKYYEA